SGQCGRRQNPAARLNIYVDQRTRISDVGRFVTGTGAKLQMRGQVTVDFHFATLDRRLVAVNDEISAAGQRHFLLNVFPVDVKNRGRDQQARVRYLDLGAQLIGPQGIGLKVGDRLGIDIRIGAEREVWLRAAGPEAFGRRTVNHRIVVGLEGDTEF